MKRLTAIVLLLATMTVVRAQQKAFDDAADMLRFAPYASVFVLKAAGVESKSDWPKLGATAMVSATIACGTTFALKYIVRERRPDGSDRLSFPSGHATVSFAGATMLHKEYGHVSPWISIAGYSTATLISVSRVTGDHHYWHDVAAGAAIGWLGTELSYRITDRLFPKGNTRVAFTGASVDVAINF